MVVGVPLRVELCASAQVSCGRRHAAHTLVSLHSTPLLPTYSRALSIYHRPPIPATRPPNRLPPRPQSNSVGYALDGQMVGVGAGQQSRVDCVKLAGRKVATWYLRQHPKVQALRFKAGSKRQDRVNARVRYIEGAWGGRAALGVW